jgi:hypothetical protein
MANVVIGALLVAIVVLLGVIAKLRSDLCYARWMIYRLVFALMIGDKTDLELWEHPDSSVLEAYAEGQLSLKDLLRHMEQKHR